MTLPQNPRPLQLAVVGHTNTGKTSLLRTLTRNPRFGDVSDSPGTTRHVEGTRLLVNGQPLVELYDTPGLEDGMALLDYIEQQLVGGERLDGPDQIARFLDSPESQGRFEQEARVLRALLECDAGLYVVDVRDPVLAKHKDELNLLARCGHPLLPVLNFTHSPQQRLGEWREAMGRMGLHAIVEFDTVAPALDGETQLYEKLSLLMDEHAGLLRQLSANVVEQQALRRQDALHLIADMVIDIAALRLSAEARSEALERAARALRHLVREREQRCVEALLKRYNFDRSTYPEHAMPLQGERWEMDLFHPEALKEVGIHVTKGVAAGAVAGATLDALTAGTSLGAGALLGATVGGLWQGVDKWGKRLYGKLKGFQELTVDDAVLRLLIVRQLALLNALERRGHAARHPITLAADILTERSGAMTPDDQMTDGAVSPERDATDPARADAETQPSSAPDYRKERLPEPVDAARAHPQWSALSDSYSPGPQRDRVVDALTRELAKNIQHTITA